MPNRLADQTSPYLLQHAHNPVDWWPWCSEAFDTARQRDVPVLLSIGYAACHWCHVMERESFEDPATAQVMNELFVCIKVDREERPDVDGIYMDAVQALTGHGGWPMTMFCTPDAVPFLGGTYFPPEARQGMPSLRQVLTQVDELWRTRRQDLLDQGQSLLDSIQRSAQPSNDPITDALVHDAARAIVGNHDPEWGGFGRAPKFPQAPVLELLLRAWRGGSLQMRAPLELTLEKMATGGMYDQLGGGFARYSVDAQWLVPHFEKMLYDNAQLARVYLHAWQAWGNPMHARIAAETLDYLLRDMRDAGGGFWSSEDADSEGVEGKFYVWSHSEFLQVAPEAVDYYGVSPSGNFEGDNILTAADGDPPAAARDRLLAHRSQRVRPGIDDKVLASWNGLVIGALAEAGRAIDRPDFVQAAREAADFVLTKMDGLHAYRGGKAHIGALLEDHACLADGLWALWEATFERRWLDECERLCDDAIERYGDSAGGGFFSVVADHDLVLRPKDIVESAVPAPGAVLAITALRIADVLDRPELRVAAAGALRLAHMYMQRAPQAVPTWLCAADTYVQPALEIAFAGDPAALRHVVDRRFEPNRVLAGGAFEGIALLRDRNLVDGRPAAYVCERYVCKLPVTDAASLAAQLEA